jgi:hypothetical protein
MTKREIESKKTELIIKFLETKMVCSNFEDEGFGSFSVEVEYKGYELRGEMMRRDFYIDIIENHNLMGGFSDEEYDKAKCAGEIEDILNDGIATFMRTDEMKELMLS